MRVLSVTLLLTLFSVARSMFNPPPTVKSVQQKPRTNTSLDFEIKWEIDMWSFARSFEVEVCCPDCYTETTSSATRDFRFQTPYYVDCKVTVTAVYGWFGDYERRSALAFRGKTKIGEPSAARMLKSRHRENGLILSWQAPLLQNGPEVLFEVLLDPEDQPSEHRQIRTVTDSLNVSVDYFNPPSDFYRVTLTAFTKDENGLKLRAPSLVRSFNYLEPDPPSDITVLSREPSYIMLQVSPVDPAHTYLYSFADRNISEYSPSGKFLLNGLKAYEPISLEVNTCLSAKKNICGEAFHFETKSNVDRPSPVRLLKSEVTSYITSNGGLRFSWEPPERLSGPLDGYILTITSPGREETVEKILPGGASSFLYFPSTKCSDYECGVFNLEISAFNTDLNNGANRTSASRSTTISIPQGGSGAWPTLVIVFSCVGFVVIAFGIGYIYKTKCRDRGNGSRSCNLVELGAIFRG